MLTTSPVRTRADLERFVKLPFSIYRNDPNWVSPLLRDVRRTLDTSRNPFWHHAERELFLVRRDGRAVGRVAAIVDRNYNEYRRSSVGFFGFFESTDDPEVAQALAQAVADYSRARGMTEVFGPANPSLNDEAGLLVGPFDSPPAIKMSYNPDYYPALIEGCGYSKAKDLHAYFVPIDIPLPEKLVRVMEKLKRKPGLQVRPVDLRNLKQDLAYIKEVYNDAWSANWDFAPMTDEEVDDFASQLKGIIVPGLCPLVFYKGEPAGMSIGLPDYNQVLIGVRGRLFPFGWLRFLTGKRRISQVRLWALGVKKKFRSLGFDSLLYYESIQAARRLGHKGGEVSWILEDNEAIIRPIRMLGGRLYKTYRNYRKPV